MRTLPLSRLRCPARRPARGLTVIELMLAIALIAVLCTIATTGYSGWRDKVDSQQAQGDIIAISALIDQQYQDTGEFPADLSEIGRDGLKDPWGNPYAYLNLTTQKGNGKARKDHSLVPLNSDYDLYSKGPDGRSSSPLTASASKDDILRANNGRFIGRASDY